MQGGEGCTSADKRCNLVSANILLTVGVAGVPVGTSVGVPGHCCGVCVYVCVCVWRVPCSKRQILTGRVYKHTGNGSQAERHDHSDKYSSSNNNQNNNYKVRARTMRASRTTTTMTTLPIYRSKIVRPCKFCMRKHLTPFSLKQCKQAATQLDASSACQGAATHRQQLTGETAHLVSR